MTSDMPIKQTKETGEVDVCLAHSPEEVMEFLHVAQPEVVLTDMASGFKPPDPAPGRRPP